RFGKNATNFFERLRTAGNVLHADLLGDQLLARGHQLVLVFFVEPIFFFARRRRQLLHLGPQLDPFLGRLAQLRLGSLGAFFVRNVCQRHRNFVNPRQHLFDHVLMRRFAAGRRDGNEKHQNAYGQETLHGRHPVYRCRAKITKLPSASVSLERSSLTESASTASAAAMDFSNASRSSSMRAMALESFCWNCWRRASRCSAVVEPETLSIRC